MREFHRVLVAQVQVSVLCGYGELSCAEDMMRARVLRALSMRWHAAFGIGGFMSSWRPT